MIQPVKASGAFGREFIRQLKERNGENDKKVDAAVSQIIEDVRQNGDAAVEKYTAKFDGAVPDRIEISKQELQELCTACDPKFLSALKRAAENIRDFHQRQKQQVFSESARYCTVRNHDGSDVRISRWYDHPCCRYE